MSAGSGAAASSPPRSFVNVELGSPPGRKGQSNEGLLGTAPAPPMQQPQQPQQAGPAGSPSSSSTDFSRVRN